MAAARAAAVVRARAALVVAEVALAVVLLVGASLFIGSFVNVMRVDPGFRSDHVLTAQLFRARVPDRRRPISARPWPTSSIARGGCQA